MRFLYDCLSDESGFTVIYYSTFPYLYHILNNGKFFSRLQIIAYYPHILGQAPCVIICYIMYLNHSSVSISSLRNVTLASFHSNYLFFLWNSLWFVIHPIMSIDIHPWFPIYKVVGTSLVSYRADITASLYWDTWKLYFLWIS